MSRPIPKWLAYTVGIIAVLNFASFLCISLYIGGDALNGRHGGGHYFLSNHGVLTEVGRTTFEYSKWHAISLFVTHPLAMIVGWLWLRTSRSAVGGYKRNA